MTNITINGLPWLGFWIFLAVFVYVNHQQYMVGHETAFFGHRTDAELRLREAAVKAAESKP